MTTADGLIETPDTKIPVARLCSPSLLVGSFWESEANARLIAAAPDLLETAKQALELLEGQPHVYVTALRAAIAKAEGK